MFTILIVDGREAPKKPRKKGAKRLEFLVSNKPEFSVSFCQINILLILRSIYQIVDVDS